MADPCANCGTDSVATCPSCNRRICNRHMVLSASIADSSLGIAMTGNLATAVRLVHPVGESFVSQSEGPFLRGYMGGSPRCFECRQRDGQAAEETNANRIKQEAAEYNAAVRGLETASDPDEITQLIRRAGHKLSTDDCRGAWVRLVQSGALGQCEHEVVKVRISHRKFWGNPATELSRIAAWRYRDSSRSEKDWLLLDADGAIWDEDKGAPGISASTVLPNAFDSKTFDVVAVSRGSEVQMRGRRGAPGWTIEVGRPVSQGGNLPRAMLSVIESDTRSTSA